MPLRSSARIVLAILLMLLAFPTTSARAIEIRCPDTASSSPAATPSTSTSVDATFPDGDTELTVFAAASLTDVFAEIGELVEKQHPNVVITVEAAGSQTLVTQLAEGARADVLATADLPSMRQAQADGLIDGEPILFTANRLVIVTPLENPAGIERIDDLAGDDIRLVMAAADVPAGRYTHTAICAWAGGDADVLAAIGDNVVSEDIDVRAVLTRVLLGEADAGIVYASDAMAAERSGSPVNVIDVPESALAMVVYPIAPVAGDNVDAARAFIAVVLSDAGQIILAEHGFLPID